MKRFMQNGFLMFALCLSPVSHGQETGKTKPQLAVLPFQNKVDNQWWKSEAGNTWWWHGGAQAAQDVFVTELRSAKRFTVVEREQLEVLIKENQLTLSGDVDPATAVNAGKILGVNYLLTGAVTEYGVTDKGSSSGKPKTLAVALQTRLIDTSTGEVVWADEARAEESSIRGVSVFGVGGGVDDQRIFAKTLSPCVKKLINKWRASRRLDWQNAK